MGMGFAPTCLRQMSPPPLHVTTLTTVCALTISDSNGEKVVGQQNPNVVQK